MIEIASGILLAIVALIALPFLLVIFGALVRFLPAAVLLIVVIGLFVN